MIKYEVEVDKSACLGFGACVELCPGSFQLSEEGKTSLKGGERVTEGGEVVSERLELEDLECVREAAEACPFNVIHITDLETGDKVI